MLKSQEQNQQEKIITPTSPSSNMDSLSLPSRIELDNQNFHRVAMNSLLSKLRSQNFLIYNRNLQLNNPVNNSKLSVNSQKRLKEQNQKLSHCLFIARNQQEILKTNNEWLRQDNIRLREDFENLHQKYVMLDYQLFLANEKFQIQGEILKKYQLEPQLTPAQGTINYRLQQTKQKLYANVYLG